MTDIVNFLINTFGQFECDSNGDDMIFKVSLGEYNLDISVKDGTTLQEFKDKCNSEYIKCINNKIEYTKTRLKHLEFQVNTPFFTN